MCGLVMLVNKHSNGFNKQQNDVFYSLLYLSGGFRGRDGTGVVVVDNLGNVELAKEASTVDKFTQSDEYGKLASTAFKSGWVMFGHNRAATRGSVTDENSHPFVVNDNIILVHNGTFTGNHKDLKDTEVDSEAIAHMLSETDTTENAMRKINAAYALMWYNVGKKEINVIRNSQRPLWYMETDDSYLYASEECFLQFVKEKFKLKTLRNPFEIKTETLSTFTLGENKNFEVSCVDLDVSYWKHHKTGGGTGNSTPFLEGSDGDWRNAHGMGRHPYSCGWGNLDSDDGFIGDVTPTNVTPVIYTGPIDTKSHDAAERVVAALGKHIIPVLNGEWHNFTEIYKGKQKIRVLVDDLVEADANPKSRNYILIGKTLDENRLHVVIPMKDKSLNEIIELSDQAIFEIEYSGITWRRVDSIPVQTKSPLETWGGLCLLHGVNPVPIYLHKDEHAAC
jgi:predicted glutamine amidotransferase